MSAATTVATATAVESTATAAMETATHAATVEPTGAAVEAASTTTEATAANSVAVVAAYASTAEAAIRVTDCSTAVTYAAAIAIAPSIAVSTSVAITPAVETAMPVAAATVESMTPVAVIPRAGADEEPADKPAGTVEAIGRAGVRVVAVIAIRADRGWTVGISGRVIGTVVLTVVAGITVLGLGALRQRQWRGKQSQRKYPSKEFLHINFPHSAALPLPFSGSCGRGYQLFCLMHPAFRTPVPP
jgi:hypothetical protein